MSQQTEATTSATSTPAATLSATVDAATAAVNSIRDKLAGSMREEAQSTEPLLAALQDYARRSPLTSLAIAAAVGLFVGQLLTSGLKGDPTTLVPRRKKK